MPEISDLMILVVIAGAAMSIHAIAGFGAAAILAPALFLSTGKQSAVIAMLILGILINALVCADRGAPPEAKRISRRLLPAILIGLPVGIFLALKLNLGALQVIVGLAVLLGIAAQLLIGSNREVEGSSGRVPLISTSAAGFGAGTLATMVGMGSPPLVLWLDTLKLPAEVKRYVVARAFILPNFFGIAGVTLVEPGAFESGFVLALVLGLPTIVGFRVGRRVFWYLDSRRFRIVSYLVASTAAIICIVSGVT